MYPFIRLFKELLVHRNSPPLGPRDVHVSRHICWPWDIDLWVELNNGRTLTLYDLGRIPFGQRVGLLAALKKKGWGLTIAGASVRYRRRIRPMETFTIRSRLAGWDDRFFYIDQSIWKTSGECANQALLRSAATGPDGIVPPALVAEAMGIDTESPPLPAWVAAWADAESTRPWPPEYSPDFNDTV
ncbi:acyl-CoA thioesterase [Pseudaestuariivita atlantica]|uniref:Thioeseterase n=1 Tax=Pseudaestuariivita atlantica TaxID=1317121 RepID=A0A0L1JQA2_9RHOB|nr:acyl-CoA thioesterase [Pseudaestuariivita atlantica]KNG93929.1 thioeseterase [Pseudaestuariivita atlantica]